MLTFSSLYMWEKPRTKISKYQSASIIHPTLSRQYAFRATGHSPFPNFFSQNGRQRQPLKIVNKKKKHQTHPANNTQWFVDRALSRRGREIAPSSQGRASGVGPLHQVASLQAVPRQAEGRVKIKNALEQRKRLSENNKEKIESRIVVHVTNIVHGSRKECRDCRNGEPFTTSVGVAPFSCDAPGVRGIGLCAWRLQGGHVSICRCVGLHFKTQVETYPSRGICA